MTAFRTMLALAAATALGAATLPATAQTATMTETETMETEATGALGEVSQVFRMAGDLDDIEIYGINDEEIGEIENVVVDAEGTHYIVVDVGGFLDIGDETVAIPMDRFAARGEESLVLVGMTEEELEALAEAGEEMADEMSGMRVLGAEDEIVIREMM
ncbi:PRC-barrel domain-containing protein [Salinarimonas sp.]|uniref:PRC-barrel domain-containing protein n=1 Tax=Salinarimonas sp. TaxID=2766526 RepID=UPI0032D92D44